MRILITNIASATAVSLTKILKKGSIKNLIVWGTEAQKYGYNSGSMLVDHYIQVSDVSNEHYTQTIKYLCQKYRIDILIPILDEELYLFSKSNMQDYVKVLFPDIETIQLFRDKLLASLKVEDICPGIIPQIFNNFESIGSRKVIIRKKKSIGSQGVIVKNNDEITPLDFNDSLCFIQDYIDGTEYTVDILTNRFGEIKLIVPRQRLQIKNGISTKVKITKDKKIIDICKQIYDKYYIPGLSNVQFIKQDNNIYFIELNMRFAGMGIASVLASYDYISEYILHLALEKDLGDYTNNMKRIKWGSIVCRYYEETILMQ